MSQNIHGPALMSPIWTEVAASTCFATDLGELEGTSRLASTGFRFSERHGATCCYPLYFQAILHLQGKQWKNEKKRLGVIDRISLVVRVTIAKRSSVSKYLPKKRIAPFGVLRVYDPSSRSPPLVSAS